MTPEPSARDMVGRLRRWLAWGVAAAAVLYVAGSAWAGFAEVRQALTSFRWAWYVPVLGLTLVNYGLRGAKWVWLLRRLGVVLPWRESVFIFVTGLAMVISPGKAGEILKPWLVRERTGAPLTTTFPALVTERLTDGIAALALAGISVSRFAGDKAAYVWGPSIVTVVCLAVLAHRGLSMAILRLLGGLPGIRRVAPKLEELYVAMRVCLAPFPLFVTVAMSLVAWFAECVGYQLVFTGFGVHASLEAATFLYAFATVAGGAMPGGLGVADGVLAGLAPQLVAGLDAGTALAAALLIRVATLWFGVLLGAAALVRFGATPSTASP
jgi:uncharacterized protein (TIRG00374 family)